MFRWLKKKNDVINDNMGLSNERKEYILNLLNDAKKSDPYFEQFGSRKHQYKLNPVISEKEIMEAEKKYNFKLPEDYFWFITNVGNGGAGPYYGITPFKLDDEKYLISLGRKTILSPMESEEEYQSFIEKYDECDDEEYDRLDEELCQGLLYIGTQGCTLNMNIIMSGENRGKILYGDFDRHRPFFAYGNSFLDWYENWLKETAKGYNMTWYGGKMPGDEKELLIKYLQAKDDVNLRIKILFSMLKFKKLSVDTLNVLYKHYCITKNEGEKEELLERLVGFNHPEANTIIIDGFDSKDPDKYMKFIFRHVTDNFDYWYDIVLCNIEKFSYNVMNDIFWRIFKESKKANVNDFLKLLKHPNIDVRAAALGNLFRFCDTNNYIDEILPMFEDEKIVVKQAINMTHESDDERIIPIYKKLLKEYKAENNKEDHFAINYMEGFLAKVKTQ
ncbi:SMI1/KNR4 family protein [Microbacteriaceae bacterium 4G12]